MNKLWVILLSVGLTIGITIILWNFPTFKNTFLREPSTETVEFTNRIQSYILTNIGRPIEGFSGQVYISVFPSLNEADFNNVKTLEGVYEYRNKKLTFNPNSQQRRNSAEEMIIEEGHETLFKNIRNRLGENLSFEEIMTMVLSQGTSTIAIQPSTENKTVHTTVSKIDEHLTIDDTLRDIDFCGTTYQIETVFIDGVDIIKKIADLSQYKNIESAETSDTVKTFAKNICGTIKFNPSGDLRLGEEIIYPLSTSRENGDKGYLIYSSIFQISATPSTNTIDTVSFFDGEHTYLTNLK